MRPVWLLWLFAPIILSNTLPHNNDACADETDFLIGDAAAYISCSVQIASLITFAINTFDKLKPKKVPKPAGQTLNSVVEQMKVDPTAIKIDPNDIEANRDSKLQQLREKVATNLAQASKFNSYSRQLKKKIAREQKIVDREVAEFKAELEKTSIEVQTQTKACSETEKSILKKIKEVDQFLATPGLTQQDQMNLIDHKAKLGKNRRRLDKQCLKYMTEHKNWVDAEQERVSDLVAALQKMKEIFLKKTQQHQHKTADIAIGNIEIQALEDLIQMEILHANVEQDQNVEKIKTLNARAEKRKAQKKRKHLRQKNVPYVDVPSFTLQYKAPTDELGEEYFKKIRNNMRERFTSLNTASLQHGILYFLSKRGFSSSLPDLNDCTKINQFLLKCPEINEDQQYTKLLNILLDLYEEDCVVWQSVEMVQRKWKFGQIPLPREASEQVGEFYEIQGKDYKIIERKGRKIASPVSKSIDEQNEHEDHLTLIQRRFGSVEYPTRHPLGRNPTKPHHLRRLNQKDFGRIYNMFNFLRKNRPQIGEGGIDSKGKIYMWFGKKWISSTMKQVKNEADHMCKRALYKGKPLRGEWSYQHPQKIRKARLRAQKQKLKAQLKERDQMIKMKEKEKQRETDT